MAFGAAVSAARKTAGWSQETLASRAGIERQYVSTIENGKQVPSIAVAIRLSRALSVPVSELLGEAPVVQETVKTVEVFHDALPLLAPEHQNEPVNAVGVPRVAKDVAAGLATFPTPDTVGIDKVYFFRQEFMRYVGWNPVKPNWGRFACVMMHGSDNVAGSMMPLIMPMALVLVRLDMFTRTDQIKRRGIYLIDDPDEDGIVIKRVTVDDSVLILESENRESRYAPRVIHLGDRPLQTIVRAKVLWWSMTAEDAEG